jgi:hypothetical protein
MERFEAKFATEGAGAKERENVKLTEQRLQREVQRKYEAEEEISRKKEHDRKERIRIAADENYRIMQQKEEQRLRAKRESAELKSKFQSEYEESNQEAASKAVSRREKALELKRGLDQQIAHKRQTQSAEARNGLDSRERALNKVSKSAPIDDSMLTFP